MNHLSTAAIRAAAQPDRVSRLYGSGLLSAVVMSHGFPMLPSPFREPLTAAK